MSTVNNGDENENTFSANSFEDSGVLGSENGVIDLVSRLKNLVVDSSECIIKEGERIENIKALGDPSNFIICPVTMCSQVVSLVSLVGHFHREHKYRPPYIEIKGEDCITFKVPENIFNVDGVNCIGILLYAENEEEKSIDSGLNIITRKEQLFLPPEHQKYVNHRPYFVFGKKSNINYIFSDNGEEVSLYGGDDDDNETDDFDKDIYVIWVSAACGNEQINCTIACFDTQHIESKGMFTMVRNLTDSQKPEEFMANDVKYLILYSSDINRLTTNRTDSMYIDVTILAD